MKQQIYKILIIISLLFLIIYLYKLDYFKVPFLTDFRSLFFSFIFLFLAFLSSTFLWFKTLRISDYDISFKESFVSQNLSVFGKYLPGKIWLLVGRAYFISSFRNYQLSEVTALSLINQAHITWIGIVVSIIGLCFAQVSVSIIVGLGILWLLLSIVIFNPKAFKLFDFFYNNILRNNNFIPKLNFKETIPIIPYLFAHWIIWIIAFYFFVNSFTNERTSIVLGFAFPFAGSIGNIISVVPGGLGVREGALTFFLSLFNFDGVTAVSLSIAARLWYISAEILFFLFGAIMKLKL